MRSSDLATVVVERKRSAPYQKQRETFMSDDFCNLQFAIRKAASLLDPCFLVFYCLILANKQRIKKKKAVES